MKELYSHDIATFFKEKGIKEECEYCGKTTWMLQNEIYGSVCKNTRDDDLSVIPIAMLICMHCGNIRQFAREYLGIKEDE